MLHPGCKLNIYSKCIDDVTRGWSTAPSSILYISHVLKQKLNGITCTLATNDTAKLKVPCLGRCSMISNSYFTIL